MKTLISKLTNSWTNISIKLFVLLVSMISSVAYAEAGSQNIGSVAANITSTFGQLAELITASSYIAGLAFSIGAIVKFKAHKDNPSQVPIGTPIMLIFVAAALIFLPSIFGVTGQTLFGTEGSYAGVSGITDF
jgi:intracellular multiplication protein IcmD